MTSPAAEQVTLYRDESAIPEPCEILGEVTAGVSANTTPYPVEVMEKYLRERAFNGYGADVVWLYNTMISGVDLKTRYFAWNLPVMAVPGSGNSQ